MQPIYFVALAHPVTLCIRYNPPEQHTEPMLKVIVSKHIAFFQQADQLNLLMMEDPFLELREPLVVTGGVHAQVGQRIHHAVL